MVDTTLTAQPAERADGRSGKRGHLGGAAPLLLRSLLAALGGVLIFLAFPPVGAWPLAPAGVAAVVLATHRQPVRRAALLGFLAGLGLFVPLLVWIKIMLAEVGVLSVGAWLGVAALQAAYLALMGAGLALVTRLPGWPVWSAALWVAQESLRGRFPFGGLTWGRLAFSQGDSAFTPYAALGGAPLVTFLVALTGTLFAFSLLVTWRLRSSRPLRSRGRAIVAATAVGVVAVPALGYAVPLPTGGRTVTVAAVQGNVPSSGLDAFGQAREVLDNHVAATHQLADRIRSGKVPEPDFVVWPENASDLDPYTNAYAHRSIEAAVRDVGVPFLVGALADGPDPEHIRNLSIVWNPDSGPGETYLKRRLVPFGEYVPFRDVITRFAEFYKEMRPKDIAAGTEPGGLTVGGVPLAVTICFDIAYDNVVREAVRTGGKLLVVQTNNASFGGTAQPEQQLAIERLRAVEHGRAVVVGATSGISAVIGPDGRLVEVSEPFTRELLVERVPLRGELTPAARLGAAPEWILAAIGGMAVVAAMVARRRAAREHDR